MILAFTNSLDATADFLLDRVMNAGLPFVRLNTDQIANEWIFEVCTKAFRLQAPHWSICNDDITTLWFRRPKPLRFSNSNLAVHATRFVSNEWTSALDGFLRVVPLARWLNFA